MLKGGCQNPDIYFQNNVANLQYHFKVQEHVESSFDDLYKITGRRYNVCNWFGPKDAKRAIVCMGSAVKSIQDVVE